MTYRADSWQVQDRSQDGYSSEKVNSHWEESAKENNEAIGLNNHANKRVAE